MSVTVCVFISAQLDSASLQRQQQQHRHGHRDGDGVEQQAGQGDSLLLFVPAHARRSRRGLPPQAEPQPPPLSFVCHSSVPLTAATSGSSQDDKEEERRVRAETRERGHKAWECATAAVARDLLLDAEHDLVLVRAGASMPRHSSACSYLLREPDGGTGKMLPWGERVSLTGSRRRAYGGADGGSMHARVPTCKPISSACRRSARSATISCARRSAWTRPARPSSVRSRLTRSLTRRRLGTRTHERPSLGPERRLSDLGMGMRSSL